MHFIRKPNFFIVGAAKAGTTALYYYLKRHPDVFMCPIKEPHYFSSDIRYENFSTFHKRVHSKLKIRDYLQNSQLYEVHIDWVTGWMDYLALFRESNGEKAIGEASTGYLYSESAAANIAEKCPKAKIIIVLRDPIERAFSHYKMYFISGY